MVETLGMGCGGRCGERLWQSRQVHVQVLQ